MIDLAILSLAVTLLVAVVLMRRAALDRSDLESAEVVSPPIRVCCGQPHFGSVCPDGRVMCQLCFSRFPLDDLAVDDGDTIDVCAPCYEQEQEAIRRLREMEDE